MRLLKFAGIASLVLAISANAQLGKKSGAQRASGSLMPPIVSVYTVPGTTTTWFKDATGKVIYLGGSQTWNTVQDLGDGATPQIVDFNAYVNFLKAHGHNMTILWKKDLPTYCAWGADGGGTKWVMADTGVPYLRSGTTGASDGGNKWDLTQFNQPYFDRLRARTMALGQNGIYAIVELFDGLGINGNRCGTTSPTGDAYPYTGANNVNSVDDGYSSGTAGLGSMTMSSLNAITDAQDAMVRKYIDTLNDLPNVIWEISEEAPDTSTFWENHMVALVHAYEAGKPYQHIVLYPTLEISGSTDSTLFNSNAEAVAPLGTSTATYHLSPANNCSGSGTPTCKVDVMDSDHSYFNMWNDSGQVNRNFLWQNFMRGANVLFMDPYVINWTSRNTPASVSHGVGTAPDTRWDNFRDNLGAMISYANNRLDLAKVSSQGALSSTTYCLADNVAVGGEFLVYAPSGGTFTVNLSTQNGRLMNVEWFNPATGKIDSTTTYTATSSTTQSFSTPGGIAADSVLYIVDAAGHS